MLLTIPHPGLRQTIREFLESRGGFEVVGELGAGLPTIEAAQQLLPDVVLVDLRLPDANGLEVTSRLVGELPSLRVVLLGDEETDAYRQAALGCGARAYLCKLAPLDELHRALLR